MPVALPVSSSSGQSSNESEDTEQGPKKPRKHRRVRYNHAYHDLVKSAVNKIESGSVMVGEPQLQPSQVGLTFWSSEEKEKLFGTLSKKGKDGLKTIAEAIGSKSEPEVHVYLQLLQHTAELQDLHGPDSEPVNFTDIPAAFEVSEACTDVLDAAAGAVLAEEQKCDKEKEREVFGDFWLLDETIAKAMADPTADDGSSRAMSDHPQLQHALELLNLESWLELSSRIFMNPQELADNWRGYVDKGQTPSICASAFIEFHNLVVTVTKRLVSSAIFFAKSRIRAKTTTKHGHENTVRQEDIMAAVDVLGMETNAIRFWHGAARRCRLDVYEGVRIRKCLGKYSYEDVERILMHPGGGASSVPQSPSENDTSSPDRKDASADESDVRGDDEVSDADGTHEGRDTKIAEVLDQQASREEEQRLWDLFPQIMKRPLQSNEIHDLPKRKRVSRTLEGRTSNWRDYMDYQKPWQRHKAPVSPASFARNRNVHRRNPTLEPTGDMDDSSEHTHDAEDQDGVSPQDGFLDGAIDGLRSDGERAEAESEVEEASDDQDRAGDGQLSSHSDAESDWGSVIMTMR